MALSFEQEPISDSTTSPVITNWTPIVPYVLYESTIAGLFYYKLVLEIRLDDASGTLLAKLKQRRNGYADDITNNRARAIFDVRDVVNSQLEDTIADQNATTRSIHAVGVNVIAKPFSTNSNQVKKIYVKGYQNYSSAANESPVDVTTGSVNDTKYYIAASLPLTTSRGTADFQSNSFLAYSLNGVSDTFLSDVQRQGFGLIAGDEGRINYVQSTDLHTVAFLNGESDFDSVPVRMYITYYDSNGSSIGSTQYIENTVAEGGAVPTTSGSEVDSNAKRLLYFGCGPGNLQAQSATTGARPSNFTDWYFYTVQATNAGGVSNVSDKYIFINQDGSCKGFKVRRLAWRNSLGCYDYFNFKKKSVQTIEVNRNNYETMLGNFNSDMYSYDSFARGKKTRQVTAVLKETLQTDWITETDAVLLESLIMSTNVSIIDNDDTDYTVPVMVTDTSFVKKTSANDGLIQYTVNIEYANPINTNS
jgi:hypothetical protein